MNRQELAHLLRAACSIANDNRVIVVGSQSILGSYDEDDLPPETTKSREADVLFWDDTDRVKADAVTGVIGEFSDFHSRNDYYVEGVSIELSKLPGGWQDRLSGWGLRSSEPAEPLFLEPHDLAVAKLAANRDKDTAFVTALLDAGHLRLATVRERVDMLEGEDRRYVASVQAWLNGYESSRTRRGCSGTSTPGAGGPGSGPARGKTTPGSTPGSFRTRRRDEPDVDLTED